MNSSISTASWIKYLAASLMIVGLLLNSASAAAEDPVSFRALVQSASAPPPVPPAQNPLAQPPSRSHITAGGKTEIGIGFLCLGAGVATIAATALVNSSGFKPSGAKTPALYAAGAGASAGGVTLIAFGFHKRSAR